MGRMQLMIHGESLLYEAFVPGIMSRILEGETVVEGFLLLLGAQF